YGPPAMPPREGHVQAPVTGVIEPRAKTPTEPPSDPAFVKASSVEVSSSEPRSAGPSESAAWFEDGERASAEADKIRARKLIAPSATDLSLFDESVVKPRRWPLALGALLVLGLVGGAVALAMSGGDDDKPAQVAAQPE